MTHIKQISVITINRNNSKGLEATIKSVISQTYKEIEYIVIDGDSKDGSLDIIKKYASGITKWVSEPDAGIYNAMNKGIILAKGSYCIFMNSGDVFASPSVIEQVFQFYQTADIISGYSLAGSSVKLFPPVSLNFRHLYHNNIPHQAEFIKRDLFNSIGLYSEDLDVLADYEFNIKAGLANASYCVESIMVAKLEEGGISDTYVEKLEQERSIIFNRLLPESVLADYAFWMDPSTYAHPAVHWLINRPFLMKIIRRLIKC